jgi:hypothetical protein
MDRIERMKRKWQYVNIMWLQDLPVSYIITVTGHSSEASFIQSMKELRRRFGRGWFPPRKLGFKPVTDLNLVVKNFRKI